MKITAQCVSCKSRRDIDEDESRQLTITRSVPMCDKCGMPIVATAASTKRAAIRSAP